LRCSLRRLMTRRGVLRRDGYADRRSMTMRRQPPSLPASIARAQVSVCHHANNAASTPKDGDAALAAFQRTARASLLAHRRCFVTTGIVRPWRHSRPRLQGRPSFCHPVWRLPKFFRLNPRRSISRMVSGVTRARAMVVEEGWGRGHWAVLGDGSGHVRG